MRRAKIVATIGPASDDRETIRRLVDAGMSVARLNASHGTPAEREATIDRIRAVEAEADEPIAVMLDLQGPEVRTARIAGTIRLRAGAALRFVEGETASEDRLGLSVPLAGVAAGDRVLLDDGRVETTVLAVDGEGVRARVDTGGELAGRVGVNLPGVELAVEPVTAADRRELELAVERSVDFVAASFVSSAADVLAVEAAIEALGDRLPLVAKIEREAAVEDLDAIVAAADAVMVARGDLGVECPLETVPLVQKRIVRRCRAAGVPVIIATEMLESMTRANRPTRAEASDVANAVLDGTDAVMLSGETAVGVHPVAVVKTMDRLVRAVEASEEHRELAEQRVPAADPESGTDALARSARYLARDVGASAIVVASESGYTALKAAKFRPPVPIVATTPDPAVRRRLALSWGVAVQTADLAAGGAAAVIENAVEAAVGAGTVESGDTVVVLAGMMTDLDRSTTNTLKVHVAAERLATGVGVVAGRAAGPLLRWSPDAAERPPGAILSLPADFDGELPGPGPAPAGLLHERPGMTGYPAMVARELGIPMVSGLTLPARVADGTVVTIDGERGVVHAGDVTRSR